MGFNLTNERIQDTYPQLLQISGSTIVDGTGSVAPILITSASYAVTASFALNAGDIDTSSLTPLTTFNAYTSSNDSRVDSLTAATSSYLTSADITGKLDTSTFNSYTSSNDSKVDALIAATSSYLTSLPSGVISSSAQIADDISGSFTSTSASLAADIATNKVDISTNTSNISTQTSRVDSLVSATSSYAVKAENNTFSGLQTFNNIAVNGTASIGYLQSVTGSAKVIGDAYIILNNDTPAQRYAGVKVFDSGSTNNSASFEFDGQTNDWFYEYTDDGGATTEFGVVMFGPGYNTRGSHVYPSNNTILKGTGDHHIVDSIITDDGSTVTVGGDIEGNVVTANTYFAGDLIGTASLASTASYVSAGNIDGTVATATSASHAVIADSALTATTASYVAGTDVNGAVTLATSADFATLAATATTATTASYVAGGSVDGTVSNATTASYALTASHAGGNFEVQGQLYSPTFAGSVASSTSSIDFDNGNFATLSLTTPTFLANPSNIKSGTTYTLIIDSGSLISNHGTAWKFAGGTSPTYSNGTDVLTCVSDGTNLYATALTDFQ